MTLHKAKQSKLSPITFIEYLSVNVTASVFLQLRAAPHYPHLSRQLQRRIDPAKMSKNPSPSCKKQEERRRASETETRAKRERDHPLNMHVRRKGVHVINITAPLFLFHAHQKQLYSNYKTRAIFLPSAHPFSFTRNRGTTMGVIGKGAGEPLYH